MNIRLISFCGILILFTSCANIKSHKHIKNITDIYLSTCDTLLQERDHMVSGGLLQLTASVNSHFVIIYCISGKPDMGMANLYCNYRIKPSLPNGFYRIYKDSILSETAQFLNNQRHGKSERYLYAGDKRNYRLVKKISTYYKADSLNGTKTWRIFFYNHKSYAPDGALLSVYRYRLGEIRNESVYEYPPPKL